MNQTNPKQNKSLKKILARTYTAHLRYPRDLEDIAARDIKRCFEHFSSGAGKTTEKVPTLNQDVSPLTIEHVTFRQLLPLVWYSRCLRDILVELKEVRLTKTDDFMKLIQHPLLTYLMSEFGHPNVKVKAHRTHFYNETRIKSVIKAHLTKIYSATFAAAPRLESMKSMESTENTGDWSIEIHVDDDRAKLLLSLAHAKLHERKLKQGVSNTAPFREDIAGALLAELHSTTNPTGSLTESLTGHPVVYLNPFSGSATFALELLLQHYDCSPFFFGQKKSILQLLFPKSAAYLSRQIFTPRRRLNCICVDIDSAQVTSSEENMKRILEYLPEELQDQHNMSFVAGDFLTLPPSQVVQASQIAAPSALIFIANPPYGERLNLEDPKAFYSDTVRQIMSYRQSFPKATVGGVLITPARLAKHCESLFKKSYQTKGASQHNEKGSVNVKVGTREFRLGGLPLAAVFFKISLNLHDKSAHQN